MSLLYFLAPLRCPRCGRISPDNASTMLVSSNVLAEPGTVAARVGDRIDISADDLAAAYINLREPAPGQPVVLLERWLCPYDHSENWAAITLRGQEIAAIEATQLTREALDQANFLSDLIHEWIEDRAGRRIFTGTQPTVEQIGELRDMLPGAADTSSEKSD